MKFARDWRLFGLLALVSVAVVAVLLVRHSAPPQWHEGARTIARIVADCPTTEVYVASGWVLGPGAETRAARREDPVFERAYGLLADQYGRHAGTFGAASHCSIISTTSSIDHSVW